MMPLLTSVAWDSMALAAITRAGANFAFCDGSVRYVSQEIDSWQLSDQELDAVFDGSEQFPLQPRRLYQWLHTRNGGEAIVGLP